jgi:hypothetical protein
LTGPAEQAGLTRLGAVLLSQNAPANDMHPVVVATAENGLSSGGEWRANAYHVLGLRPDCIIGRKSPVSHTELEQIDRAVRRLLGL